MADNPKTNPMNDEDPKSRKDSLIPDRQKVTRQVATVGVGGNIFLAAFKLFAGIFGNSNDIRCRPLALGRVRDRYRICGCEAC